MLAYAIESALSFGIFDEVMVSTDDEEFAAIARRYGANVPFMRSEKTANDFATTYDVLEEPRALIENKPFVALPNRMGGRILSRCHAGGVAIHHYYR